MSPRSGRTPFLNQASPDGIVQDVSHNRDDAVVFAQYVVIEALLPEAATRPLLPRVSRFELPVMHNRLQIRVVGKAFNQDVHVIRHHTERDNCKLSGLEKLRNVPGHPGRGRFLLKARLPAVCADREEILAKTDVRKAGQARRPVGHEGRWFKGHATD
jgi:hypothetical protein